MPQITPKNIQESIFQYLPKIFSKQYPSYLLSSLYKNFKSFSKGLSSVISKGVEVIKNNTNSFTVAVTLTLIAILLYIIQAIKPLEKNRRYQLLLEHKSDTELKNAILQTENETMKNKFQELENTLVYMEAKLQEAEEENRQIKTESEEKISKITKQRDDILKDSLIVKGEKYNKEKDRLVNEVYHLKSEISQLKNEISKLKKERDSLRSKSTEQEIEIEKLKETRQKKD